MKKIIFSLLIGMFLFAGAFLATNRVLAMADCMDFCASSQNGKPLKGCACKSRDCQGTVTCFY
jgi:hypothetical protein